MSDRGKIVHSELRRPIIFNEEIYSKGRIEIDHINYGLDKETKKLNTTKRSSFSLTDICQIIMEIDGMELIPRQENEGIEYFAVELLNPLPGDNFRKKYRLIFTTSANDKETIGTITLYRVK